MWAKKKTHMLTMNKYISAGPVPSVAVKPYNYYLLLAFLFTLLCGLREFSKSPLARQLLDTVRNNWREAEIQHEHTD